MRKGKLGQHREVKKESKDDIQEETDEKSFKDIESTSKDDKQEKKK